MPFSDRFSNLLHNSHISQAAFGTLVGASQQTVSRWVNGHGEPNIDQLIRCSRIFGVSVDFLVGASDEPVAVIDINKDPPPGERAQAVSLVDADRRWLIDYINFAINQAIDKRLRSSDDPADCPVHNGSLLFPR